MSAEETVVENEQPKGNSEPTIPKGYVSPHELSENYVPRAAHFAELRQAERTAKELQVELESIRASSKKPDKGRDQKELDEFRAKWEETEKQPLVAELDALRESKLDTEIEAALLAAGAKPGVLDPKSDNYSARVKAFLRSAFKYNTEYKYFVAHDDSGKPVYGGADAQRPYAGVREYVASLKDDPMFSGIFGPTTITGGPGYRGGNGRAANAPKYTRAELMANKALYAKFMAEERAAGRKPLESFKNLPRE